MVSEMRASTETGDRQSLEQRRAKEKIWKKNSHCLFYFVFVCRHEIQLSPPQGHQGLEQLDCVLHVSPSAQKLEFLLFSFLNNT